MRDGPEDRFARDHPIVAMVTLFCALVALCVGLAQLAGWAGFACFSLRLDAMSGAARAAGPGPFAVHVLTVPFRGAVRRLRVAVPDAELDGARALPTEAVFNSGPALRGAYVDRLVRHEAAGSAVASLVSELRRVRAESRLDDDAYLELIACAVQYIRYGTPQWRIGLPAEVIATDRGVCSDKSVLLAALLAHEGYDTCVWVFGREHHVAVGVRGLGPGFRGSGYAFVETTRRSYVGDDDDYLVRRVGSWEPEVMRFPGPKRYGADLEAAFLVDYARRAGSRSRLTEQYGRFLRSGSERCRPYYAQLAGEHVAATRIARLIESGIDRRGEVYRLLTRSGSGR
jgi:hypothetical protein